jgi:hypothetical protein
LRDSLLPDPSTAYVTSDSLTKRTAAFEALHGTGEPRIQTLARPVGGNLPALAAVTAVTASASPAAPASPVVGHVYVDDNSRGENSIGAFERHADGTLTPMPGSPFAA